MAFALISSKICSSIFSYTSTSSSAPNYYPWKFSKFRICPSPQTFSCRCKHELSAVDERNFVLHDALDASGMDTTHARAARVGFCSQIEKLCDIERETSISVNRRVDLGRAALHIAAEDDSLISHSSVPLPIDDFIERLDSLSMGYCSHYSSSYRSSPENFLECLERYLYVNKGFRRTAEKTHIEQRALYLNSVLTHRSGSVSMLSIIYSEILKMLRIWGVLDFDVEIFFPHDSHSCPRGYQKKKSTESDQLHIMTTQSLLVEMLKDLKNAFWPFQLDNSRSPFLSAAQAAQCFIGPNNTTESAFELASAKAARHRLQRGVWTSVRFGDIRRALAACERLILLKTDPKELRDYAVLLYHCGFYEESLQYLKLYQQAGLGSSDELEGEEDGAAAAAAAVEELIIRLKLIMMEEGWSRRGPQDSKSILFNNSEPW
ncbi:uncharacterized protein LOC127262573 isoform X2 [Andrographis paniculata]|uniref:uncharacterized protein LOC127262573 isoform X2 n=1 Tax=Andrographis paniculata TaxID=175694 RepID=UPI0021E7E64E|nr:uncharacterized protein LOC127262573 isoform X2 [Andrographis paniculata]